MVKIPLQFKEEHLCYCANHMLNVVSDGMFHLTSDLKQILLSGTYLPTDLITVDVDPHVLLQLHAQLGERSENLTSGIHQRLKESLVPQIQNYIETIDPQDPLTTPEQLELLESVAFVAQTLGEKEAHIDAWVQSQIDSGRNRIKGL